MSGLECFNSNIEKSGSRMYALVSRHLPTHQLSFFLCFHLLPHTAPVEVTGAWKPLFEVLGNYHFHNLVEIWPSAVGEADKVFTSHLFQLLDGSGIMQFGNLYQQVMLSFSREDAVWSPSLSWKMEMNTRFVFAIGRSVLSRVFKDAINNDPGAVDLRPLIKNDDVENAIGHIQSGECSSDSGRRENSMNLRRQIKRIGSDLAFFMVLNAFRFSTGFIFQVTLSKQASSLAEKSRIDSPNLSFLVMLPGFQKISSASSRLV